MTDMNPPLGPILLSVLKESHIRKEILRKEYTSMMNAVLSEMKKKGRNRMKRKKNKSSGERKCKRENTEWTQLKE